jgi:DNA repair exonuclease SbcCD ATPase subunit
MREYQKELMVKHIIFITSSICKYLCLYLGQLFSSRGLFTSSKVLPQTHLTLNQEIESFDDVNDKINQQHSDKSLSSNSVIEPNRDSQMEQLEKDVAAFTKKFRSELNQLQLAQENNIHNQMKIKNKVKGLGEAMSSISHIRGAVEKILSETQQKSQEQSIHIQTGLDELASRILELEKARESGSDFNSLLEVQNSKQESFRKMILDDVRLSLNETQNDIKCIENGLTSRTIALQDGMNKVRISIQDILEVQTEQRKGLEGALTSVDEIIRMDKEIEDLRNITRDIVDLLNTQGFHIMWKS